jgi:hypothetical protein
MAKINISEFRRPGVYTREIDGSVRQVPVQSELINLVPGFSRKGPVNRPVLISTPQELYEVFGDIDRTLEKKGCFFHRTILNILQTAPVWAINLLKTDETLDTLDWVSVSTSSDAANSSISKTPYSRVFDKSDFWYLDAESFLSVATEANSSKLLHFTNLSDKKASIFIFKAASSLYNVTLENWYGGRDKVPAYLNASDFVSDYMVNVLIVAGEWNDYKSLSVDARWSKYFNKNGLKKSALQNFVNDSSVSVLNNYTELSLIPYFKDANGKAMFIETVINADTEKTGVFAAFDVNALEDSSYSKGLIDLVGNNLVGKKQESINYLSYKENISEIITFKETQLNRAGNTFGGASQQVETFLKGEVIFKDVVGSGFTELSLDTTKLLGYILGGVEVIPSANSKAVCENVSIGKIRKDTLYLDVNGDLGIETGFEVSNLTSWANVPLKPLSGGLLPIAVVSVGTQDADTAIGDGLGIFSVDKVADLNIGLSTSTAASDIIFTYSGTNQLTITFAGTKNTDSDFDYKKSRMGMIFNQIATKLKAGASVIKDVDGNKVAIKDITLVTDAAQNKSVSIRVSAEVDINRGLSPEVYFIDDEQIFEAASGSTSAGMKSVGAEGFGVVAPNSSLYQEYIKGNINSGDFFYPSLYDYKFGAVEFKNVDGNDTIVLSYNTGDIDTSKLNNRKIKVSGSALNDSVFTVLTSSIASVSNGSYDSQISLIVNESVKPELVSEGKVGVQAANADEITYMKMFLVNNVLNVEFTHSKDLIGSAALNHAVNYSLKEIEVFSNKSNFKQSLEIEQVLETNKILVSSEMYSNVKVGDFLQAFVDVEALEAEEVGKKLTRIIAKRLYPSNPSLVEITTDAQIDISYFGNDPQTFRYTTMEDYVQTYTAVVLGGFKVREESMPNGTEDRQDAILDLISRNTPIFKGLVNRNKISWRYLVDCWGLGLKSNSKHQLVDLAGERLTALAFINMPSAKDFKKSSATSFVNKQDKSLEVSFIRQGGDPESNPAFLYTFAEGKGQSNAGYFFPYVSVNDNGRVLSMPPASFVCNAFMNKHTSRLASVNPWTVVAGLTNGLLTGFSNVEVDLNSEDIEHLHLMGANPIVYKMNRGFCIETDNTAQVAPQSALSFLHSREVLIELEEELYQMLLTYQWTFNTKEIRDEIKAKADAICGKFVRENGVYAFENVIDENNNTNDVIDAQQGVLDTYVEIVKNMGIIVNNITILKTGDIQSGGFRSI